MKYSYDSIEKKTLKINFYWFFLQHWEKLVPILESQCLNCVLGRTLFQCWQQISQSMININLDVNKLFQNQFEKS